MYIAGDDESAVVFVITVVTESSRTQLTLVFLDWPIFSLNRDETKDTKLWFMEVGGVYCKTW